MRSFNLNIGLNIRNSTTQLKLNNIIERVSIDFKTTLLKVAKSQTEDTLVLNILTDDNFNKTFNKIYLISEELQQDAIAIQDNETEKGWLVGDTWQKWGSFNSDYFIN